MNFEQLVRKLDAQLCLETQLGQCVPAMGHLPRQLERLAQRDPENAGEIKKWAEDIRAVASLLDDIREKVERWRAVAVVDSARWLPIGVSEGHDE